MTAQERIARADGLFALLTRLRGADFGGHPACAETDPEVFFPLTDNATTQIEAAKRICERCDVAESCLRYALGAGESGIWGGTTEAERDRMRRARRLAAQDDEGVAA